MVNLNNRLQLPSVSNCILDDRAAGHKDILLRARRRLRLNREVYPAVAEGPSPLLGELHNSTFGLKEEEVLSVGYRERRVSFLGAVCDFAADGSNEHLEQKVSQPHQI